MDERQKTLGVYDVDNVESLRRSRGDFDVYLAQTTQHEEVRSRVHVSGRNFLASGAEIVSRLVKSRSGHQGRLTHINNQISTLLYYYYYYKIETTLQPEAELRGLHIITCTTYKYIINTIL
jgi:hypothetical protein